MVGGCEKSHSLLRFGSFVTAKMSIKEGNQGWFLERKLGEREHLAMKTIHVLFLLSRLFSVITWLLLPVEVQFGNFQRGGLEDFTVNV